MGGKCSHGYRIQNLEREERRKRISLFYGLDTGCNIFLENGQRREHVPFGHMVGLCSGEGEGGHGHIQ